MRICIIDKASENLIVKAAEQGATHILVSTANWRVIPLENLIARIKGKSKLIAEVTNAEEAKVALANPRARNRRRPAKNQRRRRTPENRCQSSNPTHSDSKWYQPKS